MDKKWDAAGYQARYSFVFKYGEGVLELLDPKPGERILDLGCGSGQLTAKIAAAGAEVLGIDSSPDMIAQARANFPDLKFEIADAAKFALDEPVDAVFSNAVLHWVRDAEGAIDCIFRALKPGGRLVMEMGGRGNTRTVLAAVREVVGELELPWFYTGVAEYSTMLEKRGFEVRFASLFDRPTPVEGDHGVEDWLKMFGGTLLAGIPEDRLIGIRRDVESRVRSKLCKDGQWTIDYRRLRVVAVKL